MDKNLPKRVVFIASSTYGGERLGIQTLSSIAKEENFGVSFYALDSIAEAELLRKMKELKPDIVAYSVITYEHNAIHDFNRKLKSEIEFLSVFGGPHYTFNPEEIYGQEHMDILCVGEGERAFRGLLKCVKTGADYSGIDNLIVRRGNSIIKNPLAPLIENLDEVPFVDRKIIPLDNRGYRHLGRTYYVMISRGCPYQCTYCFNAKYNELYRKVSPKIVRWRSVDNVISEMKKIKEETDIDYFTINDDAVNYLPKNYLYEFCGKYKREISMPFSAQFRANLIDEDVVRMLKDAGMQWANCGIETGDEGVADKILRRGLTNGQIINAFRIFNKYGIKNFSQNIVGLPVEDPVENALKTIRLNAEAGVVFAQFTILLPYPKTPIEQYCVEHGYLSSHRENAPQRLSPSVFTKSILKFRTKRDNRRLDNLHKFCSIAARFPFLIPFIKILIELPPNRLFQYIYFSWYAYKRTIAPYNIKISPALIWGGFRQVSNYLKRHD